MNGLLKVVARVGEKPIALISLIISCLSVFGAITWYSQGLEQQQLQQQTSSQHHNVDVIYTALSQRIKSLQTDFGTLANNQDLVNVTASGDIEAIRRYQQLLSSTLPQVKKVCIFDASVDQLDDKACLPITFASLNSIRQAKSEGKAALALVKLGAETQSILLAYSIKKQSGQLVGVLAVELDPKRITDEFLPSYGQQGYVELQQGTGQVMIVAKQGNANWRKLSPQHSKPLADSYLKLAYWNQPIAAVNSPLMIILIIVSVFISMSILHQVWRSLLIKHDALVLIEQLKDLSNYKLKPKYRIYYPVLTRVVDEVLRLGQEIVTKESQRKANISGKPDAQVKSISPAVMVEVSPDLFKPHTIRGKVPTSLNEVVIKQVGLAFGSEVIVAGENKVIVGYDGRESSEALAKALIEGINEAGCDVAELGLVSAPVVSFACEQLAIPSGIMVTDAFSSLDANGMKCVLSGKIMVEADIQKLYRRIKAGDFLSGSGITSQHALIDDYITRVHSDVKLNRPIRVVVDSGNGVMGTIAPKLLKSLGCEVIELYSDVDGSFPNHLPNPSSPDALTDLMDAVASYDAEIGFAFDGDGSRLGVVDAERNIIFPDRIMVMFTQDVLSRQPEAKIIKDVMSSDVLTDAILRAAGDVVVSESSASLIHNKMIDSNAALGGSLTGHIFFKERWFGFDDGAYAAARLLELLTNDPLERSATDVFAAIPNRCNTPEIIVEMSDGDAQEFLKQLQVELEFNDAKISSIDGIRADFPNGWGAIQLANTAPGLALRFEADSEENLEHIQQQFKQQMLQVKPTLSLLF